jgi:hypothetical protein
VYTSEPLKELFVGALRGSGILKLLAEGVQSLIVVMEDEELLDVYHDLILSGVRIPRSVDLGSWWTHSQISDIIYIVIGEVGLVYLPTIVIHGHHWVSR